MHTVRDMRASHFDFHLISDGKRDLDFACEILLEAKNHGSVATHYVKHEGWLIFTSGTNAAPKGIQPLLYPMRASFLADLIAGWLDTHNAKEYPPKPDCDGSVEMGGFEITTEGCCFDVLFRVRPAWRVYEK